MAGNSRTGKALALIAALLLTASFAVLAAGCGDGGSGGGRAEGRDGGKQAGGRKQGTSLTWPIPYQNPARTGRSAATAPQSGSVKWSYDAGVRSKAWAVLAADGKVLVGLEGKVVCLDPVSGSLSWEFSTGGVSATTCGVGDDGSVYFSAGSKVYALSGAGQQKWTYDMGATADEPVAVGQYVYAGSAGGRLVALDTEGGVAWEARVAGDIRSPSLDRKGNLYCSASPFTLYAFDAAGKQLWEFKAEGDLPLYEGMSDWANTLDTPSIAADGTVYAGSLPSPGVTSGGQIIQGYAVPTAGKLYAVDPSGKLKWSYSHPDTGASYFSMHSPSIGQDGTLYSGTSNRQVLALNPQGTLLWEFDTGEGQEVCPSVYSPSIGSDGLLYAATTSSKMFCITPQGQEKWRFDNGTPWLPDYYSNNMTPPPIAADGTLFSVVAQGRVYAWKDAGK